MLFLAGEAGVIQINGTVIVELITFLVMMAVLARWVYPEIVRLAEARQRMIAEQLTEEFRSGAAHAGRYETSLVLAARPELIDSERMSRLPSLLVNMPAAIAAGQTDFVAMGMEQAYCGAPAEASAAEGEATFATLTVMLVQLIRRQAGR